MASFSWASLLRITIFLLLVAAAVFAFFTLPVEKGSVLIQISSYLVFNCNDLYSLCYDLILAVYFDVGKCGEILKDFLLWVEQDLGPWGPLVLAIAYIPLTILAVPASVLTIGRSFVVSKLKDYPKFSSVAIAIQKSGFKIVLLLRLVPLLPFNMLNYLLSITPVPIGEYMLASWIGMMPITLALVYIGTTLKDLSDVTHGWSEFSTTRWVLIVLGLVVSVVLMFCVTKVAKSALDKALAENEDLDVILASPQLPIVADTSVNLNQPLIIKIDPSEENHEQ
ncbi:hypothetical protein NC652_022121 [Populus alba x Populus x berolinensis]|nr:hypothetical protein NC652_022121 [Populus alba x Populus x berolinensis]